MKKKKDKDLFTFATDKLIGRGKQYGEWWAKKMEKKILKYYKISN